MASSMQCNLNQIFPQKKAIDLMNGYVLFSSFRNSTLRTPLGCAAHAGFIKTVKILAAHDTEIDPVDKQKVRYFLFTILYSKYSLCENFQFQSLPDDTMFIFPLPLNDNL